MIVIIAVLSSVVGVIASRSMKKAQASTCMSNLRQVGGLMNGYAAENNGYFPKAGKTVGYVTRLCESMFSDSFPARDQDSSVEREKFFRSQSGSMFICPADKEGVAGFQKSYLANGRITGVLESENPDTFLGNGTNAFTPKPLAKIFDTSRCLLLIEGWEKNNRLWNANDVRYTSDSDSVANFDAHQGGRHYLFVDGHVEWFAQDPGREDTRSEDLYYRGINPDS